VSYRRSYGSLLPGIILIGLGLIFLTENYFGYTLRNWWALFILIPAFASFASAAEARRAGDNEHAAGALIAGLGFTALCAVFLLDLEVGRLWPVALIVVGIALLFSRRRQGSWG
jgi:hypothetical protein